MLTARCGRHVLRREGAQALRLQQRGVGVRDQHGPRGPVAAPGHRVHGHPDGVAGAALFLLHRQHGTGCQLLDVRADLVALVPDDHHDPQRVHGLHRRQHVARPWSAPPTGCSTFMVLDFIRVPPPAARTTTVSSWSSLRASLMLPG